MKTSSQSGFTLLEVLLALAVLSVLAGLSWQGVNTLLTTQDRVTTHQNQWLVRDGAVAQWRLDWQALWVDDTGLTVTATQWDGNHLILLRRAPLRTDTLDDGLMVVAWTVRDGQWWRWASPPFHTQGAGQAAWQSAVQWTQQNQFAAQALALLPAQSWQVAYRQGEGWVNPGSSAGSIPSAVRLRLTLPDSGTLSVDVARAPPSLERP